MQRRAFLTKGATVAVAATAGCSSDPESTTTRDDGTTTPPPTTPETTESTTTQLTPTYADEPRVTLRDESFTPRRLRVRPGTIVAWENTGSGTHTVESAVFTPDVATEWSYYSADIATGNTATYTFADPGVYEYFCTVHGRDAMCGVVLVDDVRYDATLPCEE